ncbi:MULTISPECIES: fimbria/pilus chaperone family protein [Pectobacterium]|uniref:Fimbrial protein n=1 Tax=Pectobacterium odoriferum TaxID=78398 RepID=A0ABR4VSR2_9GAMM|nr:fimbria/pilus chaperone family protein [Pectobacterium odoriferum]KGA36628.1 fimbrial protein [Pectobacterium odoriferum]KGA42423.1 fimbrial protein [Pectobacterium odoriferum]MBA0189798.1 fimbria/pilus periplasmic chaperone [Pectobacterium odoriferum]MCA6963031.1 fimbria/pilus periplasmic chaperone [Pectobacterium odoriferum]MCH5011120.1 fimbria/pilus periplasmic chaperone [Pectobacterium odoriferum]
MNFFTFFAASLAALWLLATNAHATGMLPESSVVIVEESDGEGAINLKNTDTFPVLLLTTLKDIEQDEEKLLIITPPTARVEPGKTQRVRFMLTTKTPLKTERLKRVVFEGVPPQQKDNNVVRMTVRQNLPVIIRPAGLARDEAPWKRLIWSLKEGKLSVHNPSPYVVRLGAGVTTLPDRSTWVLPHAYILPGQQLMLTSEVKKTGGATDRVKISPATTWGFTVDSYEAPLLP